MRRSTTLVTVGALASVLLGGFAYASASSDGKAEYPPSTLADVIVTIPPPTDGPLSVSSGTLADGRTYGPMPALAKPISIGENPNDIAAWDQMMPDLVPVAQLESGQVGIAGFANRRSLERQQAGAPVPVVSESDFKTVVGYVYMGWGYRSLEQGPPDGAQDNNLHLGSLEVDETREGNP